MLTATVMEDEMPTMTRMLEKAPSLATNFNTEEPTDEQEAEQPPLQYVSVDHFLSKNVVRRQYDRLASASTATHRPRTLEECKTCPWCRATNDTRTHYVMCTATEYKYRRELVRRLRRPVSQLNGEGGEDDDRHDRQTANPEISDAIESLTQFIMGPSNTNDDDEADTRPLKRLGAFRTSTLTAVLKSNTEHHQRTWTLITQGVRRACLEAAAAVATMRTW